MYPINDFWDNCLDDLIFTFNNLKNLIYGGHGVPRNKLTKCYQLFNFFDNLLFAELENWPM